MHPACNILHKIYIIECINGSLNSSIENGVVSGYLVSETYRKFFKYSYQYAISINIDVIIMDKLASFVGIISMQSRYGTSLVVEYI